MSRLSFNEQGRITHHRDYWDVKDVIGLVPGVPLAQWVGTRLAGLGLSYISRLLPSGGTHSTEKEVLRKVDALESGRLVN